MSKFKTYAEGLKKIQNFDFFTGLLIALAATLVSFEWKTYERNIMDLGHLQFDDIENELIPITFRKERPKPVKRDKPIVLVVDEKEVDEEINVDSEADESTIILDVDFPKEEIDEDLIYYSAEENPEFPGGFDAMYKFIVNEIKYPSLAKEAGIQGIVYVTFIIDKTGDVVDAQVKRGIAGGALCNSEALRVINNMPRWKPGKQRGRPVKVTFTIPINFRIH